jgi:hypothetical protein
MSRFIFARCLAFVAVLSFSGALAQAFAQEKKAEPAKTDAPKTEEVSVEKLIGAWKIVKEDGKEVKEADQLGIDFTKDGKVKILANEVARFKLAGDKLELTVANQKEPRVVTLKMNAPDTLVLTDPKQAKEIELRKPSEKPPEKPPFEFPKK